VRGLDVANADNEELEGITLNVYLYVVRKGKPVGPRDVMGYLQKNSYGEYITKNKASVRGYMWIGRRMLPKMMVYALTFLIILIIELIVLAIHYPVETDEFKIFFLLLTLVTGFAMAVFAVEALRHHRRTKLSSQTE
jgi:hypothetical protein